MPGKPKKPPHGFIGIREIELEARRKGRPFSRSGFERKIDKGEIRFDLQQIKKPRKRFFFEERMDKLLEDSPRRLSAIQENETTSYTMLEGACAINPKTTLRHVQVFIKKFRRNPANAAVVANFRTDKHGKLQREIMPKIVEDAFLARIRSGPLVGWFVGESHHPPKKPRAKQKSALPIPRQPPQTVQPTLRPPTPIFRAPTPASTPQPKPLPKPVTKPRAKMLPSPVAEPRPFVPNWFQGIQKRQYSFEVLTASRIPTAIQQWPKNMPVKEFVFYSGFDEFEVRQLVRHGVLFVTPKGEITVKSIKRAFGLK